ncbi:hypothetical protein BA895_14205 [Humibacillus sp. DSM 29435]|uniref:hypothetical protein n=1 Tax=Humibacillus sp. DSM 29435 TaxID=1869167 RepID=UPI0008729293|nr:hypothetical protein [Humibacillus sp. DSM 29435]OFE17926.1 hypothetical protein BA895_14205 [Humibacillus sp. DSM 29435]
MLHRSITRSVLTAAVIATTAFSVTACSKPDATAAGSSQQQGAGNGTTIDAATAALVSSPSVADKDTGKKKDAARDRLARALHATWVTKNKQGVVNHQAIRGEVTAVTATSITMKAADGFSQTYTVGAGTAVLVRNLSATDKAGRKATASSMSAVKAGARALVIGEGATSPTANRIVFLTGQRPVKAPKTPKPATTTNPAPSATS